MLFRIINLMMATNITIQNSSFFKKFLITNFYIFCVYFILCVLAFRYPQSRSVRRVSNRGDAFPGFSRRLITSDRVVWSPGSSWGDDSAAGCGARKLPLPALRENSSSAQSSELTKEELCCIAIRVCFNELRTHWMTAVVQRVFHLKVD